MRSKLVILVLDIDLIVELQYTIEIYFIQLLNRDLLIHGNKTRQNISQPPSSVIDFLLSSLPPLTVNGNYFLRFLRLHSKLASKCRGNTRPHTLTHPHPFIIIIIHFIHATSWVVFSGNTTSGTVFLLYDL